MELTEAKNIVKQMYPGSMEATLNLPDRDKHSEAIRMVCEAACNGDKEAQGIQTCIPDDMAYMGLYPHVMKSFNYDPGIAGKVTEAGRKILDEIIKNRKK